MFYIHGNHEARPQSLPELYSEIEWRDGTVFCESSIPNLLFAKDGEVFDFDGPQAIVIGGAYSIDKYYRLANGWSWFKDEQPSTAIKKAVETKLDSLNWQVDCALSHTCPSRIEPTEAYLEGVDQTTVDKSTELWLSEIEGRLTYKKWYCGHWHISKRIERFQFMIY